MKARIAEYAMTGSMLLAPFSGTMLYSEQSDCTGIPSEVWASQHLTGEVSTHIDHSRELITSGTSQYKDVHVKEPDQEIVEALWGALEDSSELVSGGFMMD